jgi:hypothetical protein
MNNINIFCVTTQQQCNEKNITVKQAQKLHTQHWCQHLTTHQTKQIHTYKQFGLGYIHHSISRYTMNTWSKRPLEVTYK